jgi:uncharacterized protein YceK
MGGGEMAFRAICVALLLLTLPIAGCGTVANLVRSGPEEGGKSMFGGVRQDMECIRQAANGELGFRTHPKSEAEQYPQLALVLFCAADLPFSLIGDAVTWPYTASYTFINQPTPNPLATLTNPPTIQVISTPPATLPMPTPSAPATQSMPIPIAPATQPMVLGPPRLLGN